MKITWAKLSDDDGDITSYEVCYKASDMSSDIDCNLKQSINNGDTTEVVLDGLNEATAYNVAVKAVTSEGFGELGIIMTGKTLEDSKHFLCNYYPNTLIRA